MACPHFHAVAARSQTDHSRAAMLPLGDIWDGVCAASPGASAQPDESTLLTGCNLGYARGCCSHFPAVDTGADAVRFTIAQDAADVVRLYYVLERDHHPLAHGPLEYSRATQTFAESAAGDVATRLARAYVDSYLRRKSEAASR